MPPSSEQQKGTCPIMTTNGPMSVRPTVRLRVKSKTGDVHVQAGKVWSAKHWLVVDVPVDVALQLRADRCLDVQVLPADMISEVEMLPPTRREGFPGPRTPQA